MTSLFGGNLLRNQELKIRQAKKEDLISRYKQKGYTEKNACLLVVEYKIKNFWHEKTFLLSKNTKFLQVETALKDKIFTGPVKTAISISYSFPNSGKMIAVKDKTIEELYSEYRNPDDQIIYIVAHDQESMG